MKILPLIRTSETRKHKDLFTDNSQNMRWSATSSLHSDAIVLEVVRLWGGGTRGSVFRNQNYLVLYLQSYEDQFDWILLVLRNTLWTTRTRGLVYSRSMRSRNIRHEIDYSRPETDYLTIPVILHCKSIWLWTAPFQKICKKMTSLIPIPSPRAAFAPVDC